MVEDISDGETKLMSSFRGSRSLKSSGSSAGRRRESSNHYHSNHYHSDHYYSDHYHSNIAAYLFYPVVTSHFIMLVQFV